jgi:hypothetical protein
VDQEGPVTAGREGRTHRPDSDIRTSLGNHPKVVFPDREAPADVDLEDRAGALCLFRAVEAAAADRGSEDPRDRDLKESKGSWVCSA